MCQDIESCKIVALCKKRYGIDGCLGSLDITKLHWVASPARWKGQFKGMKG